VGRAGCRRGGHSARRPGQAIRCGRERGASGTHVLSDSLCARRLDRQQGVGTRRCDSKSDDHDNENGTRPEWKPVSAWQPHR
jgi:hypothetical protein